MDEEMKMRVEERLMYLLESLGSLDPGTEKYSKVIADVKVLSAVVNETFASEMDAFDRQEKRRIDEEKAKAMTLIEKSKLAFDWKKAGLEVVKIVIPTIITLIGYNEFQKRILKFEETGRLTSTASRELHLPHFMR